MLYTIYITGISFRTRKGRKREIMNFHTKNNTFNTRHCRWLIILLFTCIPCISAEKTPIYMPNIFQSNPSIVTSVIMQNEPKFPTVPMDISSFLLRSYEAGSVSVACQNETKQTGSVEKLS